MPKHPNGKNSFINCWLRVWGMIQGYAGKFLELHDLFQHFVRGFDSLHPKNSIFLFKILFTPATRKLDGNIFFVKICGRCAEMLMYCYGVRVSNDPWLRTSRNFCFHLQKLMTGNHMNAWVVLIFLWIGKKEVIFRFQPLVFSGGYRYDSSYLTSHFTPKGLVWKGNSSLHGI